MAKKTLDIKVSSQDLLDKLRAKFGQECVVGMWEEKVGDYEVIPSGIASLDRALGIGGLPRGRLIEIWGPNSSGKTTLALQFMAQANRAGLPALFIDAEHALDLMYAKKLGVNTDSMILCQPTYGEEGLNVLTTSLELGFDGIVIVDSVAALTPRAEIEGDMGQNHMGLHARMMSQACRKLVPTVSAANAIVIFINQIRSKIGVVFGNPETTTGGHALGYDATIRFDVRKLKTLTEKDEAYGQSVKIKVVKNKTAPPLREIECDLIYGEGFDVVKALLTECVDRGIIEKNGAWYKYEGVQVGQGLENVRAYFDSKPEQLKELYDRLCGK